MSMSSLTIRQSSWCLQITRTSRLFSVSFSTAPARRSRPHRFPTPPPSVAHQFLRPRHHSRSNAPSSNSAFSEARRHFTSARLYRQQQADAAAASNASPPGPTGTETPETLTVNADDLTKGLNDSNTDPLGQGSKIDWARSFDGLSQEAFSPEAAKILTAPVDPDDIEIKSDGIIYLPEIKYRRILNQAFGPGGWGLAPRGETIVTPKAVTREYALVALGRLVSVARGEQDYFSPEGIPTAVEGCKSTALRRCCKDLGIASELWDPRFIRKFLAENSKEVFVEHQVNRKRRKITLRKDENVAYPWKLAK